MEEGLASFLHGKIKRVISSLVRLSRAELALSEVVLARKQKQKCVTEFWKERGNPGFGLFRQEFCSS